PDETETEKTQEAMEKVLERLTLPQVSPTILEAKAPVPTGPKVDDKKLEALTQASQPIPPAAKPTSPAEAKPVDLAKADEKLSSLLGGKK
ncbi:MAG: hypothetical protein WCS42_22965, partial [Verrucomicrobiota bacterium]